MLSLTRMGVPTEQAKAQTEVLAEVISAEDSSIGERFATKQDIVSIKQDVVATKQDVTQEFLSVKLALEKLESKFDSKFDAINSKFDVIESKFDVIESKIATSTADVKSQLMLWVVSVGILQMALISALVLKLVH
jgi:hypothetical protein